VGASLQVAVAAQGGGQTGGKVRALIGRRHGIGEAATARHVQRLVHQAADDQSYSALAAGPVQAHQTVGAG
jgi:hypothetical protein